jgi:hypothetical protein
MSQRNSERERESKRKKGKNKSEIYFKNNLT